MKFQVLQQLTHKTQTDKAIPQRDPVQWSAVVKSIGHPAREACEKEFFRWTLHDGLLSGDYYQWSDFTIIVLDATLP